jgi:hypothetical protein
MTFAGARSLGASIFSPSLLPLQQLLQRIFVLVLKFVRLKMSRLGFDDMGSQFQHVLWNFCLGRRRNIRPPCVPHRDIAASHREDPYLAYNFGGTLSTRGATCAMRTVVSEPSNRHGLSLCDEYNPKQVRWFMLVLATSQFGALKLEGLHASAP